MKNLNQIKEEYAQLVECENWAQFMLAAERGELLIAMNVIAQDYAQQQVTSALQEAAEKAKIKTHRETTKLENGDTCVRVWDAVDKESILSLIPKEEKK